MRDAVAPLTGHFFRAKIQPSSSGSAEAFGSAGLTEGFRQRMEFGTNRFGGQGAEREEGEEKEAEVSYAIKGSRCGLRVIF